MSEQDVTRIITPKANRKSATKPRAAAAPSHALPLGLEWEGLRLLDVQGVGGFGIVYKAWDMQLERQVALKEYFPQGLCRRGQDHHVEVEPHAEATFEAGLHSFVNEAKLLAQFDHPSLVKVFRFWQGMGTAYMVMPLIVGKTLKQRRLDKAQPALALWSEARIRQVLDPLIDALERMHQKNCLHRDVSPDNILIQDEGGAPVLLDFGAARRTLQAAGQAFTVILKAGYAPVEQYAENEQHHQGPWTDVYALCSVVYFLLRGKAPDSALNRLMQDTLTPLAEDPELALRYSGAFLQAMDLGLAVQPQARLQNMNELRQALAGKTAFAQLMDQLPGATPDPRAQDAGVLKGFRHWPQLALHLGLRFQSLVLQTLKNTPRSWSEVLPWLKARQSLLKSPLPWMMLAGLVALTSFGMLVSQHLATPVRPDAPAVQAVKPPPAPPAPTVTHRTLNELADPPPWYSDTLWLGQQGLALQQQLGVKAPFKARVQQSMLRNELDPIEIQVDSKEPAHLAVWAQSPTGELLLMTSAQPGGAGDFEAVRAGQQHSWPNPLVPLVPSGLTGTHQLLVMLGRKPWDWRHLPLSKHVSGFWMLDPNKAKALMDCSIQNCSDVLGVYGLQVEAVEP